MDSGRLKGAGLIEVKTIEKPNRREIIVRLYI